MRKLFSFLAAGLLLVFNCLPVCAADTLPITHQNSYTYTVTGGGVTSILYLSLVTMN